MCVCIYINKYKCVPAALSQPSHETGQKSTIRHLSSSMPCRAALALQQHALVVPHGLHGGRHQQRIVLFQLQTSPRDDHGLKRWREKITGK